MQKEIESLKLILVAPRVLVSTILETPSSLKNDPSLIISVGAVLSQSHAHEIIAGTVR